MAPVQPEGLQCFFWPRPQVPAHPIFQLILNSNQLFSGLNIPVCMAMWGPLTTEHSGSVVLKESSDEQKTRMFLRPRSHGSLSACCCHTVFQMLHLRVQRALKKWDNWKNVTLEKDKV